MLLLDTNIASYALRNAFPKLDSRLSALEPNSFALSCITEAELLYGLRLRPDLVKLNTSVQNLLARAVLLPWDSAAAHAYADLRASLRKQGLGLSAMDLLIAAHALSVSATLVTSDKALLRLGHIFPVEDWTI